MLSQADYFSRLLGPLGDVTTAMERHGVPFDVPAATSLLAIAQADRDETAAKLVGWCEELGYVAHQTGGAPNWGSWQQLQPFLYGEEGLNMQPSPYWSKGGTGYNEEGEEIYKGEGTLKTDDKALSWLGYRYPEHEAGLVLIQALRWQSRVCNYLETWLGLAIWHDEPQITGGGWWWLHPSFGLASDRDERAGAITGRFAVKNPALNQVPAHGDNYGLRRLFRAPPGYSLVVADFVQLEVVELAHICTSLFGTTGLTDRMAPGMPDMHSLTTKYVFGEVLGDERLRAMAVDAVKKEAKQDRDNIKQVRYGLNYGKGARGFGLTLFDTKGKALGEKLAGTLIEALLDFDPEIREYQGWARKKVHEWQGVVSLFGRWCPLPNARAWKTGLKNRAYRQFLNYPLQAGGQEIMGMVMIAISKDAILARLGFTLCLTVHDEIIGMAPTGNARECSERVLHLMRTTVRLLAYLNASGGCAATWGEAK